MKYFQKYRRHRLQEMSCKAILKHQKYTQKLCQAEKEVSTKEDKIEAYKESFEKYTKTVTSINEIYAKIADTVENRKEIESNSDI